MTDADEILIGEGVVLEAGAAPVTLRMLSGLIDYLIVIAALIAAVSFVARAASGFEASWQAALYILTTVLIAVIVPATIETLTRGLSLGRLAAGVRIVRDDGGPTAFRHAIIRALVGVVEIIMLAGTLAATVSLMSARGKRIGDYLAGTYAMRTRGAKSQLPPLVMPIHLAAWASTADIRRLPDGLALSGRLFLARAATLRPESRARIGTALAEQVLAYVAPAPPPGTHPEYAMAAVLTARRDREYALERARLERADREAERLGALPHGIPDRA